MIDPKNLNSVVTKIRRLQELSKSLVTSPAFNAERIALDGEVQHWFQENRGDLLRAAQTEIRLVNLLGPCVAAAMNSIAGSLSREGQEKGVEAGAPPEVIPVSRKGASLAGEEAKLKAGEEAKLKAALEMRTEKEQADIKKIVAASDRASAQSERLTNLGCTPVVRVGDLSNTEAGSAASKVSL